MEHHAPHEPHRVEDAGATVHEVAEEDRLAALGVGVQGAAGRGRPARCDRHGLVPEPPEQRLKLVAAAVDIADDVEGPVLARPVVPERHPLDGRRLHLLGRLHHEDVPEALLAQPPERPPQLRGLVADDVRAEVPVGPVPVPLLADPLGHVEDDRHRQAVVLPGQLDQRLAGLGLDVGGVDDRQPPQGEPLAGDEPEHLEGVPGDGLVVLVVRDHRPAGVGREDLGGLEVLAGERALARAAGADQDDEAELGDLDVHLDGLSSGPTIIERPMGLGEGRRFAPGRKVPDDLLGDRASRRLFWARITARGGSTYTTSIRAS